MDQEWKFSELTYTRPEIDSLKDTIGRLTQKVENADVSETTAKKMLAVYLLLSAPKLKETAGSAVKKAAAAVTKKAAGSSAKKTSAENTVKVTTKSGKATITAKIVVDEGITKKALTDLFASLAAEAYKQMK